MSPPLFSPRHCHYAADYAMLSATLRHYAELFRLLFFDFHYCAAFAAIS
jgi:hypothetical protein